MAVLAAVFWFALGAIVGSFLNVVVYRLPAGLSIVSPGSHCPACRRPIRWFDNVPIFAWLWLGGRCRDCREPIALRYPFVEFLTAILFLSIGWPHTAASLSRDEGIDRRPVSAATTAPVESAEPSPPGAPIAGEDEIANNDLRGAAVVAIVHLLLLSTLLAAALIAYDGGPTPRRLFLPAWIIVPLAYAPEWGHSAAVYAGLGPWRAWQPMLGAVAGVLLGWAIEITMRLSLAATEEAPSQSSPTVAADHAAGSWIAKLLSVVLVWRSSRRTLPAWSLGCLGIVLGWAMSLAAGGAALAVAVVAAAIGRAGRGTLPVAWACGLFLFAWAWLLAAAWR